MPPKSRAKKTTVVEDIPNAAAEPVVAPVAAKKSKKAPKVVAIVTPEGIEGSFLPAPRRPLIAHLQISSTEVLFHDRPMHYDPTPPGQPEPYDASITNVFSQQNETLLNAIPEKEEPKAAAPPVVATTQKTTSISLETFTKCDLLLEFRETKTTKLLPEKTNVACFWCAHTFDWKPSVIPEREEKGTYRVYGNFCGPCCGMAYLLNEALDTHVRWERIALLHRLYGQGYVNGRIFPAPTRQSLQLFGGPMTIEQYRATINAGKVRIDTQTPPMVSILGSIDTKPIDFYDSSMKHTISPLLGEIVPKAEEGLRLKRSKPLKEKDSTLDSVLKIQVKGKA
jgi:hypothetical protein